jgi:hypothetical protein
MGRKISVNTMKVLEKVCGKTDQILHQTGIKQSFSGSIQFIIRAGDYKLASYIIKDLYKLTNFGFNDLHFNVLQDYKNGEKLPEFKSISAQKKAG